MTQFADLPCRRVVAGTDFSEPSLGALRLGLAWARFSRAGLELVHATRLPEQEVEARRELLHQLEEQAHAAGAMTARELQDRRASARHGQGEDSLARLKVGNGDALDVLDATAKEGAWLVVGAEGSSSVLTSRVARVPATLALRPRTPLLVAPPKWGARRGRRERGEAPLATRILIALSGGPRDARRLAIAVSIAKRQDAALLLAHVVDLSGERHHPKKARDWSRQFGLEEAGRQQDVIADLIDGIVPLELEASSSVAVHVVRQGPVDLDLAGLARAQDADLIVMGSGFEAARLAQLTPCALLVIP